MASNVFGKPVTEGTRLERAASARKDPNADYKRDEAIAYVRKQKSDSGNGVSTLCIFYNATGETLYYDQEHSWYGRVWDLYPMEVQNGQWGAFLHVKRVAEATGSMAYVIYRVEANNNAGFCSCLIGWETPWNRLSLDTHAFCDVYDDGKNDGNDTIYKNLNRSARQVAVQRVGCGTNCLLEQRRENYENADYDYDPYDDDMYQD
ncbi:hypothetical protein Tco_0281276 [Tanacetum coccineum]